MDPILFCPMSFDIVPGGARPRRGRTGRAFAAAIAGPEAGRPLGQPSCGFCRYARALADKARRSGPGRRPPRRRWRRLQDLKMRCPGVVWRSSGAGPLRRAGVRAIQHLTNAEAAAGRDNYPARRHGMDGSRAGSAPMGAHLDEPAPRGWPPRRSPGRAGPTSATAAALRRRTELTPACAAAPSFSRHGSTDTRAPGCRWAGTTEATDRGTGHTRSAPRNAGA